MESEGLNLENIIWFEVNAVWLYPVIQAYEHAEKSLGMNYLSLGSLRYDEKYFVGYIFHDDSVPEIELVTYIQYKMNPGKLTLNYLEVAENYRGNGLSRIIIDKFAKQIDIDPNLAVEVTTLSADGKRADLLGSFEVGLNRPVVETSKRSTM